MSSERLPLDRRDFITACGCLAMMPVMAACASMATRPVAVTGGRVRITLASHPELASAGGSLKLQAEGEADPMYVLALEGGAFAVISPICTHRGCTVDIQGARLVCPCHGSTYDREGKVLRGPAERALTRYDSTVSDGVLDIRVRAS